VSEDSEGRCPCCRGAIESFPGQDGACDHQCVHCGWGEHVPGSQDIAAALTLHGEAAQEREPTIVLFVEGGVVQGVEGNARVRVVVCDFDCPDEPQAVGGRPCHIGVWDSPEQPGNAFGGVLALVGRNEREAGESSE